MSHMGMKMARAKKPTTAARTTMRMGPMASVFVIVGGEVLKHGLEIAGAFADGDHVDGQRREIACGAERFRDALA